MSTEWLELYYCKELECCRSSAKLPEANFSSLKSYSLPTSVSDLTSLWLPSKPFWNVITDHEFLPTQKLRMSALEIYSRDDPHFSVTSLPDISTNALGKCLICDILLICSYRSFTKLFPCWNMAVGSSWICGPLLFIFVTRITLSNFLRGE